MLICDTLKQYDKIRHGFFTRQGGFSTDIYHSLNLGIGSHDDTDAVEKNRQVVCDKLDAQKLLTLYQIHSNIVIVVDEHTQRVEADAMVTNHPDIALGILTADCVPVLFYDPTANIIGAAHAGWKGAMSGILENTIRAMIELGADASTIAAAIGPAISQESYEVGEEFYQRFVQHDPQNRIFFVPSENTDHYQFNLTGYVHARLKACDIGAVEHVAYDTLSNEDMFYSYRRATQRGEADYGRQVSAIVLR